jgi:PST family polysaccharide transporter
MFPLFSRIADDRAAVSRNLVVATALLAACAFPPMALAAVAAPELVSLVLGAKWAPAVPLISILAIAGARETVFYITPALMKALGLAGLNLRFEIVSTSVQVAGIVIGLQFGLVGVALGYLIAGIALTPVILVLQRRTAGTPIRAQLGSLLPAVHISAWGALAYFAVSLAPLPAWAILVLGSLAFVVALVAVALLAHRRWAREVLRRGRSLLVSRQAVPA